MNKDSEKSGLSILQKAGAVLMCLSIVISLNFIPHGWCKMDINLVGIAIAIHLQVAIYHFLMSKTGIKKKEEFKRLSLVSDSVSVVLILIYENSDFLVK